MSADGSVSATSSLDIDRVPHLAGRDAVVIDGTFGRPETAGVAMAANT